MDEACPNKTAERVAMRRAAHQILDKPVVFDDPLAVRILDLQTPAPGEPKPQWLEETPLSTVLRASFAARSRYAEDALHAAVKRGVGQYVILGAGLDTFAYRNTYSKDHLQVFEVDHPATQAWKRARLEAAGIAIPDTVTYAPVDFEQETLADGLRRAGLDTTKTAFFSWLGVTMYLTVGAVHAVLRFVAAMPAGSGIVFDYMIPPTLLNGPARKAFDGLADRVARAGEPFQTFFEPGSLRDTLLSSGFGQAADIGPDELDACYFAGRSDRLRAGRLAHLMNATV